MVLERSEPGQDAAVLCSGGLESAVLLAEAARDSARVQPLYVSVGLAWEAAERENLERLRRTPPFAPVLPVVSLRFDVRDIYPPGHWAIRGEAPGFDTPDEDVYLEGRNLVLLTKAGLFAARARLPRLLVGTLAGNPFPDATPEFFAAMSHALSIGLATPLAIEAPFAQLSKAAVIVRGAALDVPLELTLSCMQPVDKLHCGRCSKCRERRDAFMAAEVVDKTVYAAPPIR